MRSILYPARVCMCVQFRQLAVCSCSGHGSQRIFYIRCCWLPWYWQHPGSFSLYLRLILSPPPPLPLPIHANLRVFEKTQILHTHLLWISNCSSFHCTRIYLNLKHSHTYILITHLSHKLIHVFLNKYVLGTDYTALPNRLRFSPKIT